MPSRQYNNNNIIIDALNKTSDDYGMKINIKKTKVMRVCKTGGK